MRYRANSLVASWRPWKGAKMPDATYVGAGMPCGNCGNPLTAGQPHKCGRTPDFDRRLDESWEPSPAASPDERLREAAAWLLTEDAVMTVRAALPEQTGWGYGETRRACRALSDALAAADREAPDEGTHE